MKLFIGLLIFSLFFGGIVGIIVSFHKYKDDIEGRSMIYTSKQHSMFVFGTRITICILAMLTAVTLGSYVIFIDPLIH